MLDYFFLLLGQTPISFLDNKISIGKHVFCIVSPSFLEIDPFSFAYSPMRKSLKRIFGSPFQGSEHPGMFSRHFAEVTFPSTFRYKPVSEPVFKNLKPV